MVEGCEGSNADCELYEAVWVYVDTECYWSSDGGGITEPGPDYPDDPETAPDGTGSSTTSSQVKVTTIPNLSLEESLVRNIVQIDSRFNNYSETLLMNHQFAYDLLSFIQENNESSESIEFGLQACNEYKAGGEVDFTHQIIYTSAIPECTKNIIKQLINDNTYLDLGDMPDFVKQELNLSGFILNLFDNSNNYNLIFDAKPNMRNGNNIPVNANTDVVPRDPNNAYKHTFKITINSDYIVNGTDLALARTIIHESVHAYIEYMYQDQRFSDLSMALSILLSADNNDPNSAQHKLMTQQFIENIANSLEHWDNSSINDNNYYYYMSWSGGMLLTPAFEALDGATQANIESANIAEGNAINSSSNLAKSANTCQ